MKKGFIAGVLGGILWVACACQTTAPAQQEYRHFEWEKNVGAHTKPTGDSLFYVNLYGAVGDAQQVSTEAIQAALDACGANGGGIVAFDPGVYLTGAVFVPSNTTLRIDKGVTLRASQDLADYRYIDSRIAGVEMRWPAAIVNVVDQENVAITGDGVIEGRGKPFWDKYWETRREYEKKGLRWIVDYDVERPRGILVQNCKNVTLSDFVVYQTGFWAVHILYSQFVTMDGVIISNNIEGHGPSTDGVDIDSSSDILVQHCDITCNDDNFCLKAGRDADGLRVNRPCERVVIRDCIARHGGGVITCGSETSGGIRDIVAYNLQGIGTSTGIRFKSAFTRGGVTENIYLSEIQMTGVRNPIVVDLNWNPAYSYSELPKGYDYEQIPHHWKVMLEQVDPVRGMPTIRNVYFENIVAKASGTAISIGASERSTIDHFHLKNVTIEAQRPGVIKFAKDWTIENVKITAKNGENVVIEDSPGVNLYPQQ